MTYVKTMHYDGGHLLFFYYPIKSNAKTIFIDGGHLGFPIDKKHELFRGS